MLGNTRKLSPFAFSWTFWLLKNFVLCKINVAIVTGSIMYPVNGSKKN